MKLPLFPALLTVISLLTGVANGYCQWYVDKSLEAAANLQRDYYRDGSYPNQWVWLSALNAFYLRQLDELTNYWSYGGVINTVFNGWEGQLDWGGSFDDPQWVAIAYIQAGWYDQAKHYYDVASQGWDWGYCSGGVFWSNAWNYKNAITSELYMTSSGYFYDRFGGQQYLDNLKNTWNWLKWTRMRGDNGLFNDGLTNDGQCNNNGQTQWTYNQGALLPGLGYLYKYTGDESVIQDAWGLIEASMAHLTINGYLREACESQSVNYCNADQQAFKGILANYISWFLRITGRDNNGRYAAWVRQQADGILQNSVGPPGWYSNLWYGQNQNGATWSGQSQASALAGLVAAAALNC
ncbi:glycoside hydrolase family 76 protein [Pluteus cervinus]|uniref:Glycoside hydrolase family 76 protein n=1 Tax=Pluteus cervinus TaxID=181527 RepID=A0ACD3AZ44_9AGAR|nr:glycoside hydrolase family 76 protein [Pluteus cervinus]